MNEKLIQRRKDLHLTQKQVAEKVGIAESAYQRYEYKTVPAADTAIKIAKALKTIVERLWG